MTGVVLFGGVGGERLVGTGTTPTPEPACESSAVKKNQQQVSTCYKA